MKLKILLLSFVLLLCFVCTSWSVTLDNFSLTNPDYSSNANLDTAVKNELGAHYRVADWNDIKAYYNNGGDMYKFKDSNSMVTLNGNSKWYSDRQYYIDYSDRQGRTPYDSFLSHGNLDQLYLGSWYLNNRNILAYTDYPNAIGIKPTQNPFKDSFNFTPVTNPDSGLGVLQVLSKTKDNSGKYSITNADLNSINNIQDTFVIVHGWRSAEIDYYYPDSNQGDKYKEIRGYIVEGAEKIREQNPNANILLYNWEYAASLGDSSSPDKIVLPAEVLDAAGVYTPEAVLNKDTKANFESLNADIKSITDNGWWVQGIDVPNTFVPEQAQKLSDQLTNILNNSGNYQNNITFIGHSLGAGIVADVTGNFSANNRFSNAYLSNVNKIVLLDAPTNKFSKELGGEVEIEKYLKNINKLGNNISVENYVANDGSLTNFGSPVENAPNFLIESSHRWIVDWYFNNCLNKSISGENGKTYSLNEAGTKRIVTYVDDSSTLNQLTDKFLDKSVSLLDWAVDGFGYIADNILSGFTQSPVLFQTNLSINNIDYLLQFEYMGEFLSDEDIIFASINDEILFSILGKDISDLVWYQSGLLDLSKYIGSEVVLTLGLFSDESGHNINFRDIGLYKYNATVPEPTTIILFGLGLLSLAGISRKIN